MSPTETPAAATPRKTWILALVASALGFAAALLLLEVTFRFLPVREPFETRPVTREDPYLHFKPNATPLFSIGWNFEIVNRVRVNNFGFVNDQDYDPHATTPLLAVIGDSYVEAAQVPYRDTLQGRLAASVGTRGRVYSFASSGSPLTQYLAYARFARDRFRPAALAIVVVGNDFDESLMEHSAPGFHYFARSPAGSFSLEVNPFEPSALHRVFRRSALIRYVHGNGFVDAVSRRLSGPPDARAFVGNVGTDASEARLRASREVVDYFLAALPRESRVDPGRIVLLVDGARPELYDARALESVQDSYFSRMRKYLIERARAAGYRVADMEPRFIARHAREAIRFEWTIDAHWNAAGHGEAAQAVADSGVLREVFGLSAADTAAATRTQSSR